MKFNAMTGFVVAAALTATPLWAQQADDPAAGLTSDGFATDAKHYGRSSTVLTAKQIKTRGFKTVQDALRTVPGVTVLRSDGLLTEMGIRGGDSGHILVLIDGVKASGGDVHYVLNGMGTANIDRIEVLRGAQSVIYGSNASTGVINIITRTGGTGIEYSASSTLGSYGSKHAAAYASVRNLQGGVSFSYSSNHDAGWDLSGDGGERDETNRNTLILKADYALANAVRLGFNLRRSKEYDEADIISPFAATEDAFIVDDPTRFMDRDETTFSLFAEHEFAHGRAVQRLSYEVTDNDQSFIGGPATNTKSKALTYRLRYGVDGPVHMAQQVLDILLEREQDSSNSRADHKRSTNSIAVEYRGRFASGFNLQAGLRYSVNKPFQNSLSWAVGGSYNFDNGLRLHASAGRGGRTLNISNSMAALLAIRRTTI